MWTRIVLVYRLVGSIGDFSGGVAALLSLPALVGVAVVAGAGLASDLPLGWKVALPILGGLVVEVAVLIALVIGRYRRADLRTAPHVHGQTFRIVDAMNETATIVNRTFEDCDLLGPAVLVPIGYGTFDHCAFEGDPDLLMPLPDQATVTGVIRIEGCVFRRCVLKGVSLMVPREQIPQLLSNFTRGTLSRRTSG